jgi:REP element-mobilizing transposase RayT
VPFHVLNRAVGRRVVFQSAADYEGFIDSVAEMLWIRRMRICGYCVMPNH